MIITDDGSTDNTKDVVKRYQKADKRIIYINKGKSKYYTINRNRGVQMARGEYMVFFDDDSIHHPEFLIEHIMRHKTPDVLISYSGRKTVLNVDPATLKYEDIPKLPARAIPMVQYAGETESLNGTIDVGDYMVKTKDIRKVKGFSKEMDLPSYCSDMKLVDMLINKNPEGKIVMIPRVLHVNFMYGHDHMTKRKLEARERGEMVEEEAWEWS
jgi:glycosyltransferase involved in cell wall biosynthesis